MKDKNRVTDHDDGSEFVKVDFPDFGEQLGGLVGKPFDKHAEDRMKIAAMAMQGLIMGGGANPRLYSDLAFESVMFSDALLAELNKG